MFSKLHSVDFQRLATVAAESGVLARPCKSAKSGQVAFSRGGLERRIRGAHCHFASVHVPGSVLDPNSNSFESSQALCGYVTPC